jgi:hypothetical protein
MRSSENNDGSATIAVPICRALAHDRVDLCAMPHTNPKRSATGRSDDLETVP